MIKSAWIWAGITSLVLVGCGGLSDVGNQKDDDTAPVADAKILNHAFTRDGAGKATTSVRAGSEVFLSGKDSEGTVAPVLRYDWCQRVNGSCADARTAVPLVIRTNNTVSFTAPTVSQDTLLQFRLTVTDAKGHTDASDIDVNVVGIPDEDHFLSYNLDDSRQVKLVAIGSRAVSSAELASNVGFTIEVKKLVRYSGDPDSGTFLEVGAQTLTGEWLKTYGVGNTCADPQNPSFLVPIPAVDIDEVIAKVGASNPALEPNAAKIDNFRVKLQIDIRTTSGSLPGDVMPLICADRVATPAIVASSKIDFGSPAFKQTTPSNPILELSQEEVLGAPGNSLDTRVSAQAYYDTIDPGQQRMSLSKWLALNEFIPAGATQFSWAQLTQGSSAHAVYTNNFDLGFGRDMYARIGRCDDGPVPALGQPLEQARIGKCDIAAVVVNYANLEAATKHLNPVLAVAMEYSATPSNQKRIVKFFTYAPDSETGEFKRVLSANLDGRGEKFMPQVCTVCHGGTPGGLSGSAYAGGGDVGATFLPWDLDSFLFSDVSGTNSDHSYSDESQRSLYTRDTQSDQLRRLNQIAYLTYLDAQRENRYILPRQLIEGWYGTQGARAFTSTAFNGTYVPPGWSVAGVDGVANTADDNPADAPRLYHDVFSRNCRACHVAQQPSPLASGSSLELMGGAATPVNRCDAEQTLGEPNSSGISRQVPMGCYRELVSAPNLAKRLSAGQMPFARLTMDRFWVLPTSSNSTAGGDLLKHLNGMIPQPNTTAIVTVPGSPTVCFTGLSAALQPGIDYLLDASCSTFAHRYRWTLTAPDGSAAAIAFADRPFAILRGVDKKGTYGVALETATNVTTSREQTRVNNPIQIPSIAQQTLSPVAPGNSSDIPINAAGGEGDLVITNLTSADPSRVTAVLVGPQAIRITGLGSGQPVTVSFNVVDGDGDSEPASFSVRVNADLTANSFIAPAVATRRVGTSGAATPIQLRTRVSGAVAGQTLRFVLPNLTTSLGGTLTLTDVTNGTVMYTPPAGRMSQFRVGSAVTVFTGGDRSGADSFDYTVRYEADATASPVPAQVTVPIEGNSANNVLFTQLYNGKTTPVADAFSGFSTDCDDCHERTTGVPALDRLWFLPDEKNTYCGLRKRKDENEPYNSANAYVNLVTPSDSALYLKPTGGLHHQQADATLAGNSVGSVKLHAAILQWIQEGAYYTSVASQVCP